MFHMATGEENPPSLFKFNHSWILEEAIRTWLRKIGFIYHPLLPLPSCLSLWIILRESKWLRKGGENIFEKIPK
jgi:hypothetical protein